MNNLVLLSVISLAFIAGAGLGWMVCTIKYFMDHEMDYEERGEENDLT